MHGESVVASQEGKEVARGDSIYTAVKRDEYAKGGAESLASTSVLATAKA